MRAAAAPGSGAGTGALAAGSDLSQPPARGPARRAHPERRGGRRARARGAAAVAPCPPRPGCAGGGRRDPRAVTSARKGRRGRLRPVRAVPRPRRPLSARPRRGCRRALSRAAGARLPPPAVPEPPRGVPGEQPTPPCCPGPPRGGRRPSHPWSRAPRSRPGGGSVTFPSVRSERCRDLCGFV